MAAQIILDILGPILALVLLGAWVRRQFRVDVGSLSKLNIYLFVPGFFFDHVVHSTLGLAQAGGVILATALQVAVLGLLAWGVGRLLGVNRRTLAAVAMCVMFYNSGNFGLALSELAYPGGGGRGGGVAGWSGSGVNAEGSSALTSPPDHPATRPSSPKNGPAAQAFVVFTQNLLNFSVGLLIAKSAGGGSLWDGARAFLRMPTLYTIAAALLARWWRVEGHEVPKLVTATAAYLSKGLVPVALVTLGAQLALTPRWPRWKPVSVVLLARLVWAPAQMAALLYGLHALSRGRWPALDLWPWPAENLVVTAGVPTAVNTLLVTLEVGGDAELTADCVFWTTVFSAATITAWLVAVRVGGVFLG